MTSSPETNCKSERAAAATLAKALAPEDIRKGDFVAPLYVIAEVPTYWWCAESWNQRLDEPVRIRFRAPCEGGPFKVRSVCLPFVLVKSAAGEQKTLDLRTYQLARLDREHAKRAWKAMKKGAKKKGVAAM
jgi:hypothetical protein